MTSLKWPVRLRKISRHPDCLNSLQTDYSPGSSYKICTIRHRKTCKTRRTIGTPTILSSFHIYWYDQGPLLLHNRCNYFSMRGLKLINASKRTTPMKELLPITEYCVLISDKYMVLITYIWRPTHSLNDHLHDSNVVQTKQSISVWPSYVIDIDMFIYILAKQKTIMLYCWFIIFDSLHQNKKSMIRVLRLSYMYNPELYTTKMEMNQTAKGMITANVQRKHKAQFLFLLFRQCARQEADLRTAHLWNIFCLQR